MNKIAFIFVVSLYVALSILGFAKSISIETQSIVCAVLVFMIGIPHGAIDHILLNESQKVKSRHFYIFYLGLMVIYILCWMAWPVLSLILFLVLSAYHFGQSQFSDARSMHPYTLSILSLLWGVSLLSGLIYYNNEEVISLFSGHGVTDGLVTVFDSSLHRSILIVSTIGTIATLFLARAGSAISSQRLLREIYLLFLIHISFYILPLLIGFTLYFVILHSIKVLTEEYQYLIHLTKDLTISKFIGLLLPMTVSSIVGSIVLLVVVNMGWMQISYAFLALVMISLVTLPHSIVMEFFYKDARKRAAF